MFGIDFTLGVDIRSLWAIGKDSFTAWVVPSWLAANFLYLRFAAKLPAGRTLLAGILTTAIAWLLVVYVPLGAFLAVAPFYLMPDGTGLNRWIVFLIILIESALVAALAAALLLRIAFHARTTAPKLLLLWLANFVSVVFAAYRMIMESVSADPYR